MKTRRNISKIGLLIGGGVVGLAAVAGAAYYLTPGSAKEAYAAMPVSRMDLTETVTATGQTAPDQESVLAFDGAGGTIGAVNVSVGDHVVQGQVLASLRTDILQSQLQGAQADVAAAQAELDSIEQGAAPADVAVYSQKSADAETSLSSAVHDAYLKTQDAIENQTGAFFSNPLSPNPVISVPSGNIILQQQIDQERVAVNGDLAAWQTALQADTPNQVVAQAQTEASTTLASARDFLFDLGDIMNNLNPNNSGFSQSQIQADQAAVTAASTEVTAAQTEYTGAISGLDEANSSLNLEVSSATPPSIEAAQAAVSKAEAEVAADQSQLGHAALVAPFDGIVTDVEPVAGDVFAIGVPAITVISSGPLKVEVQVPETDIGKLAVGDAAEVSLDAYGSGTLFPATVTTIDPGQTNVNGVASYTVTLHFQSADPRILSGMTANISVMTASTTGALAVPQSDIITQGSQTFVLVEGHGANGQPDGAYAQVPVTTGITGSNGYVEIMSGLSDGDMIASL